MSRLIRPIVADRGLDLLLELDRAVERMVALIVTIMNRDVSHGMVHEVFDITSVPGDDRRGFNGLH